jgi:L-alanine-DL-glutamate epimerase-like enolase superfamily enzyme
MRELRRAIGPSPKILIDFHWRYSAAEAIQKISQLEPLDLYVAEAPVAPEDMDGQAQVAAALRTPVGIGEELRTVYEYLPRFVRRSMDVIQPEMGRTGLTSFVDICKLSQAFYCRVMPHASIGIGIFQAASLQVTATLPNCPYHEYQHSIFDKNLRYINGDMKCADGYFTLPSGPGLGVEPNEDALAHRIGQPSEALHA